ncbi:MAG: hypothetical protein IPK79_05890 [Vampirovibrionales bacterium]|nr:hypothetical protein [Vampirovibrionales bacterium]
MTDRPVNETLSTIEAFLGLSAFGRLDTDKNKNLSREELMAGVESSDTLTKYGAGVLLRAFDTLSGLDRKEGLTLNEIRSGSMLPTSNPPNYG